MTYVHILMAVLAAWRLTEIITQDKISEPLRKRWPLYIWTCNRCVSVWASAACTALFALWPWLNWPLAISWLYIARKDYQPKLASQRIVIERTGEGINNIGIYGFGMPEVAEIGKQLLRIAEGKK